MQQFNIYVFFIVLFAWGSGIHCGGADLITQSDGEEDEETDDGTNGSEDDTNASGAASAQELEQMISGNTFHIESDNFHEDQDEVCDAAEEDEEETVYKFTEAEEDGGATFNEDGTVDFTDVTMHWEVMDEDTIRISYGGNCEYWDVSIEGNVMTVSWPEEFDCTGDYCAEDYEWDS